MDLRDNWERTRDSARRLKGYDLIWRDLNHVRDISLSRFEPVVYPKMTDHLWS